jgi:hypothetical protein
MRSPWRCVKYTSQKNSFIDKKGTDIFYFEWGLCNHNNSESVIISCRWRAWEVFWRITSPSNISPWEESGTDRRWKLSRGPKSQSDNHSLRLPDLSLFGTLLAQLYCCCEDTSCQWFV